MSEKVLILGFLQYLAFFAFYLILAFYAFFAKTAEKCKKWEMRDLDQKFIEMSKETKGFVKITISC